MTPAKKIKLTRFASPVDLTDPDFHQHAWVLKVIAEASYGDASIFVFQRGTGPLDPEQGDTFRAIASVHDMFELPRVPITDGDDMGEQTPYYRGSSLTLVFRTPVEVEDAWKKIQEDTHDLMKNLELEDVLRAVAVTTTDGQELNHQLLENVQHTLIKISYHPAGSAGLDDGEQVITNPDDTVRGWLPVSEVPAHFIDPVPGGTLFFYNIDQHQELKDRFPPEQPFSQHSLFFSGLKMSWDTQYIITRDTIYWKAFETSQDVDWADMKVPWPADYVDADNPGENPPEIELMLFET